MDKLGYSAQPQDAKQQLTSAEWYDKGNGRIIKEAHKLKLSKELRECFLRSRRL